VKTIILFGIAMLCPLAALTAQEIRPFDAKPGLWESTMTMEISGMPAMPQLTPDQLAKMPPAARQQMESMMNGRGGAPRTITSKSCTTREEINKGMAFSDRNQANCTRKIVSSSSSKVELHVECAPDKTNMTVVSDVTVERLDAEHVKVTGTSKSTGTGAGNGAARTMDTKFTVASKWLSSDCGDVKPAGEK
jgi:hypothetical protein